MKRVLATVGILLALVVGVAAPAQATPGQYVTFVRAQVDDGWGNSRYQIIKFGKAICKGMDSGITPMSIGEMMMDEGFSSNDAAAYVVGAAYFLCPRHKAAVNAAGD